MRYAHRPPLSMLALLVVVCSLQSGCDWILPEEPVAGSTQPRSIYALGRLEPAGGIISISAIPGERLQQLDPDVREAVLGNAGTVISFRLGARDAAYLAQEFQPHFSQADFIGLPNHEIYLRLMIDGAPSRPFSAVTLP